MRFLRELTPPRLPDPRDPAVTLADVERAIRRLHPVPHLTPEQAETLLAEGSAALFDVRADAEFREGHIAEAIRLDPATTAERFVADHGGNCAGRFVVFACSVGLRSARMAERVADALSAFAPAAVANLSGGLFRWEAEGRRPALPGLHQFDAGWGALLERTLRAQSSR
jgi:rhodanese-related sulfurtransferase